jgi:hypothetical protein
LTEQEQSLLDIFRQLSEHDAHSLLRFAEFLAGYEVTTANIVAEKSTVTSESDETETQTETRQADDIPQPEKIERPEQERVVDALKRLSATYPMLDKKMLLDKASELVAQHVMFGKPAKEVIDQIEQMFADAYAKFATDARRGQ